MRDQIRRRLTQFQHQMSFTFHPLRSCQKILPPLKTTWKTTKTMRMLVILETTKHLQGFIFYQENRRNVWRTGNELIRRKEDIITDEIEHLQNKKYLQNALNQRHL